MFCNMFHLSYESLVFVRLGSSPMIEDVKHPKREVDDVNKPIPIYFMVLWITIIHIRENFPWYIQSD